MSILNNITPMSDAAELVMMLVSAHPRNIKQRIADLHDWAEIHWKKMEPGMKCTSNKSFAKIPQRGGLFTAVAFRGGPAGGLGRWQGIELGGSGDQYKLCYIELREAAVRNTHNEQMFFDIYEIPNELFVELKNLCNE